MAHMGYIEEEKKDMISVAPDAPKYPYGLRISLGPEELEKLGLQSTPEVDVKYRLLCEAKVIEVSVVEGKGDDPSYRVELQIMDLEMKRHGEKQSSEAVIYGE